MLRTEPKEPLCAPELRAPDTRCVCFVCTGNTCRSPMAAALVNDPSRPYAKGARVVAFSRGLYANEGEPISRLAIEALEAAGVAPAPQSDYHDHIARTVTEADVARCDWLVAVSDAHAMQLLLRFPGAAHKITCLPEAILDPFGGDAEAYRLCLAALGRGVDRLLAAMEETK